MNIVWLVCFALSAVGLGVSLGWRLGWGAAYKRNRCWSYRITLPHWTTSGDGLTLVELERAADYFDQGPACQVPVSTGTRLIHPVQAGAMVLRTKHSIRPGTVITLGGEQRTTGATVGSEAPYTVLLAIGERPWTQDHPAESVVHYTTTLSADYRTHQGEVDQ